MFTFNFLKNVDSDDLNEEKHCADAVEIKPSGKELKQFAEPFIGCAYKFGNDIELKSLPKNCIEKALENDVDLNIKKAEDSHSDLVSGIYEGGLKIWECTFDLGHYLTHQSSKNCLEKKIVLDLGCGAGLLGIIACKLGALQVDFQDYNAGVIKHLTIPNTLLNFSELPKVRFWYGDWGGFRLGSFYDVILTSETIYQPKAYFKLHELFKNCLKPGGFIILAAKSYYFGVGGSLGEFLSFIEKENIFTYKNVWCSNEGIKREIVELRFKKDV
ncbi:histidine protein methyltransferase 1 homolog [Halyomorpha halys]|uniref:histidine protein methyltransferase 1 homolog n=1 Tax=Halyomorpha halys TaxID=286706 RepID=UPI0006D4F89C|nr:histidine protein methyltransferase 1 homolog [Halyomorpha halys]